MALAAKAKAAEMSNLPAANAVDTDYTDNFRRIFACARDRRRMPLYAALHGDCNYSSSAECAAAS